MARLLRTEVLNQAQANQKYRSLGGTVYKTEKTTFVYYLTVPRLYVRVSLLGGGRIQWEYYNECPCNG
jgi:hypothetical protein